MIMEKMDEMIQIYNRTEQICFDDKKIKGVEYEVYYSAL